MYVVKDTKKRPIALTGESDKGKYYVHWIYVDRNFTMTGSYYENNGNKFIFEENLKKGWNIIIGYSFVNKDGTRTNTSTTGSIPAGAKWVVE